MDGKRKMVVKTEPLTIADLQVRLDAFEDRFAMTTNAFLEAFRAGELHESEDFRTWSMTATALRIAQDRCMA